MYVPPLESLLRALGIDRAAYERSAHVTLPKDLFKFLLLLALESSEFNESGYLKENPDIPPAIRKGEIKNAREHYLGYGYFEGRTGATPTVDEAWYLANYKDVAQAVRQGEIPSARDHFNTMGVAEGRSPNAADIAVAEKWKKALARNEVLMK